MSRQPKRQRQGVQAGTAEQPETEVEPAALTRFLSACSFCLTCNRVRPSARQHKSTAMKKEGVVHDLRPMAAAEIEQEREKWLQRQVLGPGERARQSESDNSSPTPCDIAAWPAPARHGPVGQARPGPYGLGRPISQGWGGGVIGLSGKCRWSTRGSPAKKTRPPRVKPRQPRCTRWNSARHAGKRSPRSRRTSEKLKPNSTSRRL